MSRNILEESGNNHTLVIVKHSKPLAENAGLLDYWKTAVGQYVRELREKAEKAQKELPVSRRAVSDIENSEANFTLGTLIQVLDALGGNVSDAFRSRVPRQFHGDNQVLHEQLQVILEEGQAEEQLIVAGAIRWWFAALQARRR